ncbi:MAG: flavodoxin-dependent (E)-4-hydroxy-3-methylbut-2-enyl-diphosphate synthase, partial [Candidatus Cloacimonadaceae bacterium]|nr:flavodoxin-dependent (E)-4-hydroxy-3-methylbut-2-enyl-diphosphate synthase [Candidatus Cloacimonadaceae bacterium]
MTQILRRKTRPIMLGNIQIGGDAPISIQSMLNVKTANVQAAREQMKRLISAGCEIIRFSVMDMDDALAIPELKRGMNTALVADIHFDYRLALAAIENGIDGLR